MRYWQIVACAYAHYTCAYVCQIWALYVKSCDQESCSRQQWWQWQQQQRWQQRQTTDTSWLYKLIGLRPKWAKNAKIVASVINYEYLQYQSLARLTGKLRKHKHLAVFLSGDFDHWSLV